MTLDREDGASCISCGHRRPDLSTTPLPDDESELGVVRNPDGSYRPRTRRRGPSHGGKKL